LYNKINGGVIVIGNKGGRPLKFQSVEQLQTLIDKYFDECDIKNKPYTITGLANALDTDRITLIRYQERDEFSNTIKKAKRKVEEQFEERSLQGKYNPTIAIFLMKNNFGYQDKVDLSVEQVEEDPISKALKESMNSNGN